MTETRNEALDRLVHDGVLSAEQATAVRDALDAAEPPPARARWAELAGYVGGGLLLAGALTLTATSWADLSRTAHIVILLAATAALLTAGIALVGGRSRSQAAILPGRPGSPATTVTTTVRGRSGSVSMAVAAITAALAVDEIAGDLPLVLSAAAGLALAAAGYALVRAAPGTLMCAFFAALTAGSLADEISDGSALAVGLSLVGTALVWTALVLAGVVAQRRLGLGIGAAIALFGAQQGVGYEPTMAWAYGITLAVAVACLALYRREHEWVLLVAGVGGFTLAVPEAIWDWTDGAVGGSFIMMIAGVVLVVFSVLGIRLHHSSRTDPAERRSPQDRAA